MRPDRLGPCGRERERKAWNIFFGQPFEALRATWETRPGGAAVAAGPGVELQRASLTTSQDKALYVTDVTSELSVRVISMGFLVLETPCPSFLADLNVIPHLSFVRSAIDVVGGQTAQRC